MKVPSLYEYYIGNGKIYSGLQADGDQFTLNHKPFVIYSGSLHYFRIVPEYWRQTLAKFKAAGLNTVQFYLAWNRHEFRPGEFDFESDGLNLTRFLMDIRDADMFAIVRPGPYICAEWEMGGLPPWLLKDPEMRIRSDYPGFLERVRRYYSKVFKILNHFQFTKNGGPIIALQIENELFGDVTNILNMNKSLDYLRHLHDIVIKENNFKELLFTSDPASVAKNVPVRSLQDVLETANLNQDALHWLMELRRNQPQKPIYVSEFWPGWFNQWGEPYHQYSLKLFEQQISEILFQVNGSVNFYMFIGGTNFGFFNGARVVTSYDYNAPISESGNYTDKYWKTRELYRKLVLSGRHPEIRIPSNPPPVPKTIGYGTIFVKDFLPLDVILEQLKPVLKKQPVFMEFLDDASGFGFILYRFKTKPIKNLRILGPIHDRAILMINGQTIAQIFDGSKFWDLKINSTKWFPDLNAKYTMDILVENLGRANWGVDVMNHERKGINSTIFLDDQPCQEIQTYTFDLNQKFMNLTGYLNWDPVDHKPKYLGPRLYRAKLNIEGHELADTFLELPGWTYGNVFINNFNLGRYDYRGPQKTLYIPRPLWRSGSNFVHVFELGTPGSKLEFVNYPKLS